MQAKAKMADIAKFLQEGDVWLIWPCIFYIRKNKETQEMQPADREFYFWRFVAKAGIIGHFTVVCSATKPMNGCEAAGDLALIQTSLLLSCKLCCCNAN